VTQISRGETKVMRMASVVVLGFLLLPVCAYAGALEDGQKAYKQAFQEKATKRDASFQKAFKLWLPLAKEGDPIAEYRIGRMYRFGEGVKQNPVEAIKWFRKSADQGPPVPRSLLEALYARPGQEDVTVLHETPDGPDSAQYALSNLYTWGQGVKQDYVQAYMWKSLLLARCDASNDELAYLAEKMTPEQIAEARRLAATWKPTRPQAAPAP
jgi:TPR repeat protein